MCFTVPSEFTYKTQIQRIKVGKRNALKCEDLLNMEPCASALVTPSWSQPRLIFIQHHLIFHHRKIKVFTLACKAVHNLTPGGPVFFRPCSSIYFICCIYPALVMIPQIHQEGYCPGSLQMLFMLSRMLFSKDPKGLFHFLQVFTSNPHSWDPSPLAWSSLFWVKVLSSPYLHT